MNDGVAMLLERMKTHPEEFYSNVTGKWSHIINTYKPYLNDKDAKALEEELATLMQQRFTEEVMQELVEPKKLTVESVTKQYRDNRLSAVLNGGAVSGTLTVNTPIAGVTQTL